MAIIKILEWDIKYNLIFRVNYKTRSRNKQDRWNNLIELNQNFPSDDAGLDEKPASAGSSEHRGQAIGRVTNICVVSRDLSYQIQSLLFENQFRNYYKSNICTQLNIQLLPKTEWIVSLSLSPIRLPVPFLLIIIYLTWKIPFLCECRLYTNNSFLSNAVSILHLLFFFFSLNVIPGRSFHTSSDSCIIIQHTNDPNGP